MVGDGIKAARIQARHSPLISSTWPGVTFQASVLSAVRHATGWLDPHRIGRRPAGRHAAPTAAHRFLKMAKSTRSTRMLATRSRL
jgi:hypothetical protein